MKTFIKRSWFIGWFGCVLLTGAQTWAADADSPAGPAFTDPAKLLTMPEEWRKKAVKYQKWGEGADLAISLDQHLYPAVLPIIEQYAKDNNLNIKAQEGTCGTTSKILKEKSADIGGFCCPPATTDRLPGLKFYTVGILPLELMVHPANKVSNLSLKQVRDIFQGNIFHWSKVGGSRKMIQPVSRLHCKQRPGHWRLLLDNEDLFSPRLQDVGSITDMLSEVAGNPAAIGYSTSWMAIFYKQTGKVKTISIDGISHTDRAKVATGKYPLYRALTVSAWQNAESHNPQAEKLIKHLIASMDKTDKKYGIIPISEFRKAGWKFHENELIGEP